MNKPAGKIAIFALILAMTAVSFGDFLLLAAGAGVENSNSQSDVSYGSNIPDLSYKPAMANAAEVTNQADGTAPQILVALSPAPQYSLVAVSGAGLFPELRMVTLNFSGVTLAVGESASRDVGIVVTKKEAWEKSATLGTARGPQPVGTLNVSSSLVADDSPKTRISEAARKADKENAFGHDFSNLIRSVELRC